MAVRKRPPAGKTIAVATATSGSSWSIENWQAAARYKPGRDSADTGRRLEALLANQRIWPVLQKVDELMPGAYGVNVPANLLNRVRRDWLLNMTTRGGRLHSENLGEIFKKRRVIGKAAEKLVRLLQQEPDSEFLDVTELLIELRDNLLHDKPLFVADRIKEYDSDFDLRPQAGRKSKKAGNGQQLLFERQMAAHFWSLTQDKTPIPFDLIAIAVEVVFEIVSDPVDPDDIAARWRSFLNKKSNKKLRD